MIETTQKKPTAKIRLAFVGGGPATLAAVYHLTRNEPERYEITIYEMSWRLGGKTASGRDAQGRIEEHGLHILFGSYHNVFRTLCDCYEELRNKQLVTREQHWLQYFSEAIQPHHYGVIGDDRGAKWERFDLSFPSNRGIPGDPPLPTLLDLGLGLFQLSWMVVFGPASLGYLQGAVPWLFGYRQRWEPGEFNSEWGNPEDPRSPERRLGGSVASRLVLKAAIASLDASTLSGKIFRRGLHLGQRVWSRAGRMLGEHRGRMWSAGDFFFAMSRGIVEDQVLSVEGGFEAIDAFDFREWLSRHGAEEDTLGSPWIRALYDAAFSYPLGGIRKDHPDAPQSWPPGLDAKGLYENIAAGVAARAILTTVLTYKGSFYNKMVAGMGDVIHTPLYLVLKARGVRFEFFHRLIDAIPGPTQIGGLSIERLEFDTLPPGSLSGNNEYDPLVPVAGLLCWPSAPNLSQINSVGQRRASEAESCLASDAPHQKRSVRSGEDYDAVVLGVPVAALPYSCPSLLAFDAARADRPTPCLSEQPSRIDTVRTVALQLWFEPTLAELGWPRSSPLLSLFLDPLNTWCDVSHLLPREPWPEGRRPGNLAYFCGPIPHEPPFPPPGAVSSAQIADLRRDIAALSAGAVDTCLQALPQLLPATQDIDGFNYGLLADPRNGHGSARLESQYWRINHEPQACCTLALSGKTQYRLGAGAAGYDNLFLTGDWTANGLYIACVEGAVQSGIRTARTIAERLGGAAERYWIVAEELLNLQVMSPQPKLEGKRPAASAKRPL